MIFTAGFGTRMGALCATRPKPLIKVGGKPLIDHALGIAKGAGIARIAANLHYLPQMLEQHLSPKNVLLSHEHPDILDTGGGLRQALPLLGAGPVFSLNPDAIWKGENPLTMLARAWNPDRMDALLLLIPPTNALGHKGPGDFHLQADQTLLRGLGMVYSGAQIIKTDLLHTFPKGPFSLNLVWSRMIENRRLSGVAYGGKWCDVGHPAGITMAEAMLEEQNV